MKKHVILILLAISSIVFCSCSMSDMQPYPNGYIYILKFEAPENMHYVAGKYNKGVLHCWETAPGVQWNYIKGKSPYIELEDDWYIWDWKHLDYPGFNPAAIRIKWEELESYEDIRNLEWVLTDSNAIYHPYSEAHLISRKTFNAFEGVDLGKAYLNEKELYEASFSYLGKAFYNDLSQEEVTERIAPIDEVFFSMCERLKTIIKNDSLTYLINYAK